MKTEQEIRKELEAMESGRYTNEDDILIDAKIDALRWVLE